MPEYLLAEFFRISAAVRRPEVAAFKNGYRFPDSIGSLGRKKDARGSCLPYRNYGLQNATSAVSNNRCATGLRLNRGNAEIFLGSKNKGPGMLHIPSQHVISLVAKKPYAITGNSLDFIKVRAFYYLYY